MATVYRFGDFVAIHAGGPTRYVTAKDARKLAAQLTAAARSIKRTPFHESSIGTVTVPDYAAPQIWAAR